MVAQGAFDQYRGREVGWEDVRESWMRRRGNGRPTPWDLYAHPGKSIDSGGARRDLAAVARSRTSDAGESGAAVSIVQDGVVRTIVPVDSHRYFYALPIGIPTASQLQIGPLLWAYDGQQVFGPGRPAPRRSEREAVGPRELDADLGRTVRLDRWGRRWLLVGYDAEVLAAKVDRYDRLVLAEVGEEPQDKSRVRVSHDDDVSRAEVLNVAISSWALWNCEGDSGYEVEDYLSGGLAGQLTAVSTPNIRQRKSVSIQGVDHATGYEYFGSGVMIDDETVLTAAHVFADSAGYTDLNNMRICTLGNMYPGAQCVEVDSFTAPGGVYDGTLSNDYGIIKLKAAIFPSVGWMAMSGASDSIILPATQYHDGFPSWRRGCVDNRTFADSEIVVDGYYTGFDYSAGAAAPFSYGGAHLNHAYGPVDAINSQSIYFKF